MKHNYIQVGDCIEVLKELNHPVFQMSFADPPFNLEKSYATYKDDLREKDYIEWCEKWITEMVRVTKPGGSIFLHNIPKWLGLYFGILSKLDLTFRHWIAWDAATSPMGHSLQPAHYGILYFTKNGEKSKIYELRKPHERCRDCKILNKDYGGKKSQIHPFGPLISDVWTDIHRCKHGKYKDDHPCQLPIHLMERLILLCTDESDLVLDCFMGSGTTAIASKRLGRSYYGIELDKKYVEIADIKLEQENTLSKLDSMWVSCFLKRLYTVRDIDVRADKSFQDNWKQLYETWVDTDEARKGLNRQELKFRKDIQERIVKICDSTETSKLVQKET